MKTILRKFIQDIIDSYWLIPACIVLSAVLLCQISLRIDENPQLLFSALPAWALDTHPDVARNVLVTIAQSMIGVAGVMYSMTLVAVSFAAGTFGPRLIDNFMRDRGTQVSLSVLLATFVFALLTLRTLQRTSTGDETAFIPHLSILTAMSLALISIGFMIYFIHHIPETINLSNITASLGKRLHRQTLKLSDETRAADAATNTNWLDEAEIARAQEVLLDNPGFVQTLNIGEVRKLASRHDWHVSIEAMPGDFVDSRTPVARIWSPAPPDEKQLRAFIRCYALGQAKTENQNMLFMAEKLVEIIARAMSPAMNDPFTAITGLNWLHVSLKAALAGESAVGGTARRVRIPPVTFLALLKIAHEESRAYLSTDSNVTRHALSLLDRLAEIAPLGPRRDAILRQRDLLRREAQARDPASEQLRADERP